MLILMLIVTSTLFFYWVAFPLRTLLKFLKEFKTTIQGFVLSTFLFSVF